MFRLLSVITRKTNRRCRIYRRSKRHTGRKQQKRNRFRDRRREIAGASAPAFPGPQGLLF